MLDRLAAIIGAFDAENGTYELHEMRPDIYRGNMRPTRSTGPSAGRVGIARKSAFLEQGSFMAKIDLEQAPNETLNPILALSGLSGLARCWVPMSRHSEHGNVRA